MNTYKLIGLNTKDYIKANSGEEALRVARTINSDYYGFQATKENEDLSEYTELTLKDLKTEVSNYIKQHLGANHRIIWKQVHYAINHTNNCINFSYKGLNNVMIKGVKL